MVSSERLGLILLGPLIGFSGAFFLLPMGQLVLVAGTGAAGVSEYAAVLVNPRYLRSLIATTVLSGAVTAVTLVIGLTAGLFLTRNRFLGRSAVLAMLTFPLAFPGVVVGFMVILLGGRQGLIGSWSEVVGGDRVVFAYSMLGLFVGYLYFSIPRVLLTIMGAVEKLDPALDEAARSLGARRWQVLRDVTVPALRPALLASGAVAFATAMGAFGTAFTLATRIDVLAMVIYTEFTLNANFATAASLSIALGLITWLALAVARSLAGTSVAAAG